MSTHIPEDIDLYRLPVQNLKKTTSRKDEHVFPFFLLPDVHLGAAQKYQQKQGFVTYVY